MERDQLVEFTLLQNEALKRIRAGANRKGYLSQFRAVVLPSFEDNRAYEILRPPVSGGVRPSNAGIAVRTVWRRPIDVEKFRNPVVRLKHGIAPQPTIEETEADIELKQVNKLLSKASKTTVPVYIADHSFGVDGTGYELVLGSGFVEARFKWWCNAPRGWEPLSDLFCGIKELVENAIVDVSVDTRSDHT